MRVSWLSIIGVSLFLGGCGDDGNSPKGDGGVSALDGSSTLDGNNADASVPIDGNGGTSSFTLRVEEVNIGSEVETFTGSTAAPSREFGATISNGRINLAVKDPGRVSCEAGVNTTSTRTVPGTFSTDSGFTDGADIYLIIGNTDYDRQGSGQLVVDSCPAMGDMVTATLSAVRLASSFTQSIKVVSGTMRVQVVADDGSLNCK